MMRDYYTIFLITMGSVIFFASCKKDKIPLVNYENLQHDQLTGDKVAFVGKWNWLFTDHYYGWCNNQSNYEYLNPTTENVEFRIQFFENGFVHYFKNGILVSTYRILFDYFDINSLLACGANYKQFSINLDGFTELNLSGCFSNDTLRCHLPGFIFYSKTGCENYVNTFVKE